MKKIFLLSILVISFLSCKSEEVVATKTCTIYLGNTVYEKYNVTDCGNCISPKIGKFRTVCEEKK